MGEKGAVSKPILPSITAATQVNSAQTAPKKEAIAEPKVVAKVEPKPEPKAELKPEPKPELKPEPKAEPKAVAKVEDGARAKALLDGHFVAFFNDYFLKVGVNGVIVSMLQDDHVVEAGDELRTISACAGSSLSVTIIGNMTGMANSSYSSWPATTSRTRPLASASASHWVPAGTYPIFCH